MRRFLRGALPLAAILAITACGSPLAQTGQTSIETTPATAAAIPRTEISAARQAESTPTPAQTATVSQAGSATAEAPSAAKNEAVPTETTAATNEPPVTAMMAELELAGEPYAAIGDPDAPLTVVEFSDYG